MKTLEEVNELLSHHTSVGLNRAQIVPSELSPKDKVKLLLKQKRAYRREYDRLVLMRNYLERVSPENIAATHEKLSAKIARLEQSWRDLERSFGRTTSTVIASRKKQYEKETELPKLRRQLKEMSWLID